MSRMTIRKLVVFGYCCPRGCTATMSDASKASHRAYILLSAIISMDTFLCMKFCKLLLTLEKDKKCANALDRTCGAIYLKTLKHFPRSALVGLRSAGLNMGRRPRSEAAPSRRSDDGELGSQSYANLILDEASFPCAMFYASNLGSSTLKRNSILSPNATYVDVYINACGISHPLSPMGDPIWIDKWRLTKEL